MHLDEGKGCSACVGSTRHGSCVCSCLLVSCSSYLQRLPSRCALPCHDNIRAPEPKCTAEGAIVGK